MPNRSDPKSANSSPSSPSALISSVEEIRQVASILQAEEMIAFDTEFIRESTFFPIVEIIQVATETQSWLFDARIFKKNYPANNPFAFDTGIQPLLDVFSNSKILKIVHAAQGDQECLYTSFGVVATPVLDTAVAASLCGHGDGIGLGKLLKSVLGINLTKGHARTNWSARPLPQQLTAYALADVEFLVKLGKNLLDQLEEVGRKNWALELSKKSEDITLYQSNVDEMSEKLARGGRLDGLGYAALRALVKWREERVRQLNLPRRWVADDQVLIDLAHVRPKDLSHLSTFRGLNKGELRNSGEAILDAIANAKNVATGSPKKESKPPIPSQEEAQVLELLRCFIGILADEHKIAAKHLLTTGKLLPIIRSEITGTQDFMKNGFLTQEAVGLVGDELLAMLQGKRALTIRNNKIHIVEI